MEIVLITVVFMAVSIAVYVIVSVYGRKSGLPKFKDPPPPPKLKL